MVLYVGWKSADCKCERHYSFLTPVLLIYASVLIPVPHCTDYCSFAISVEIGKCDSFNFVLFFRMILVALDTYNFNLNMNFLVSLSISENKSAGILVEIALNLQINLGSMTILTTLRLLTHKHRVSFYILFVSTMFVVFRVYWFYPFWQVKFTPKYFTTLRL